MGEQRTNGKIEIKPEVHTSVCNGSHQRWTSWQWLVLRLPKKWGRGWMYSAMLPQRPLLGLASRHLGFPTPRFQPRAPCFPPTSWAAGLLPGFSCIFSCSEGIALRFRWVLPPFVLWQKTLIIPYSICPRTVLLIPAILFSLSFYGSNYIFPTVWITALQTIPSLKSLLQEGHQPPHLGTAAKTGGLRQPFLTRPPPRLPSERQGVFVNTFLQTLEDFRTEEEIILPVDRSCKGEEGGCHLPLEHPWSTQCPGWCQRLGPCPLATVTVGDTALVPNPAPAPALPQAPTLLLRRRAERRVSMRFLQHCCNQLTTLPPAPI